MARTHLVQVGAFSNLFFGFKIDPFVMIKCLSVLSVVLVTCFNIPVVMASSVAPEYTVQDGKVDKATFNGYRRYHGTCHACHGQDANGGSFAPSLVESLKSLGYDEFKKVILEGRQVTNAAGGVNAMPAFANDKNVTKHLDDIYRYLAARSDGVLGGGRPEKLPKP